MKERHCKLNAFAQSLGAIRESEGLFPREQVAYHCNVTEQTVRNFENGVSVNPSVLLYYIIMLTKGFKDDRILNEASDIYKREEITL